MPNLKETNPASLADVYSKQARRRRFAIFLILLLAAYLILLAGSWIIIRSPLFRIRRIEVEGNKNVSSEDAVTIVRAEMSGNSLWKRMLGFQNLLAWPTAVSAKTLAFLPELKSVSVEKDYRARTLTVRVEERQPFGIWCTTKPLINADSELINADNGSALISQNQHPPASASSAGERRAGQSASNCFWFDREGILFRRSFSAEGSLISLVDDYSGRALEFGSAAVPEQFVQNLFSVLRAISGSGISVKEIRLNDLDLLEIEVDTYDGPKIYFSLRFPADSAAAVIQSLMKQEKFNGLQYLDFRTENRAYYK